ncbi:25436_t:CDS:2 [Gigaspora margarita]|uniref:25436_t:CDS:1 n=1 Tax=Gigaspora margarita TaxID=4874 RepID=A0ABN7V2D9_GIGMA|nr:25436_t:CDS:2 [Gigaspora margarita]
MKSRAKRNIVAAILGTPLLLLSIICPILEITKFVNLRNELEYEDTIIEYCPAVIAWTIIAVIYTILTKNELGGIPPNCPSSATYSTSITFDACRIRLANLISMWLFEFFGILWTIAHCCGQLPKSSNRNSNITIDGELENLYSDDELAAEKLKNGGGKGKRRGNSHSKGRGILNMHRAKEDAIMGRKIEFP